MGAREAPDARHRPQAIVRNRAKRRCLPNMRMPVCEDADAIAKRVREIAAERDLRCPRFSPRSLYECLTSPQRCNSSCPYHDDWIGP